MVENRQQVFTLIAVKRREIGMSQKTLADRSEISKSSVSEIESGKHLPRVDVAIMMARALGTTVEELFVIDEKQDTDNNISP